LIVWQKGHLLILDIYRVTQNFPKEELYGLTSQIRRAVISVTSNIVEGFVRHSKKEKIQFYFIALGSATEVESQLLIAKDLKFMKVEIYYELSSKVIEIVKMLNKLIKSISNS